MAEFNLLYRIELYTDKGKTLMTKNFSSELEARKYLVANTTGFKKSLGEKDQVLQGFNILSLNQIN